MYTREALRNIYNVFVRPHRDYEYVFFDQAFNVPSHKKTGSMQYSICLGGTSKRETQVKIFSAPSLVQRALSFYKTFKNKSPAYLLILIPAKSTDYPLMKQI